MDLDNLTAKVGRLLQECNATTNAYIGWKFNASHHYVSLALARLQKAGRAHPAGKVYIGRRYTVWAAGPEDQEPNPGYQGRIRQQLAQMYPPPEPPRQLPKLSFPYHSVFVSGLNPWTGLPQNI